MMNKVFHFDTPRENYKADAAIIWCFDHRFQLGMEKFLKRLGILKYDRIKIGGGAKSLSSPARETDRDFILDQIRTSIRLHETERVVLIAHSDCGACGGLARFDGNAGVEAQYHEAELRRAVDCLKREIPCIHVQAYFADFEGIWQVELAGQTASG